MSRLAEVLGRILQDVSVPHALVGGLAVSARTEPRFTRDVDLAIACADDRAAEALVSDLGTRGYRVVAQVEQETAERLSTVRLMPPGDREPGLLVDLLFASSGIEAEVIEEAEDLEVLPGIHAPVARVAHLMALKLLARDDSSRPQDGIDLRALLGVVDQPGLERVRTLLALIQQRGFARDKDLLADLDALLRQS